MHQYRSGADLLQIDQHELASSDPHPALLLIHGSGGATSNWLERLAPLLNRFGVALYAPHYFEKTKTQRATAEVILDGKHFYAWLEAVRDSVSYVASRPAVDHERIAVLGVSLGAYLAVALATEDPRVRAVVDISGGVPSGWEDRITADMPPTLIVHGQQDHVVPISEAHKLRTLLQAANVQHELDLISGESHWFSPSAQARLLMKCGGFLSRHLEGPAPRRLL